MAPFIRLHEQDNVITATASLEAGTKLENISTASLIPRNHKIASQAIGAGEAIYKYAQIIGYASMDIEAGAHVHTHNVSFRNTQADYEFSTNLKQTFKASKTRSFHGISTREW